MSAKPEKGVEFSFENRQIACASFHSLILSNHYLTLWKKKIILKQYDERLDQHSAFIEIESLSNRRLSDMIFGHGFTNFWHT